MKQITVHLNDYPANKRMSITFGQSDFDIIAKDWNDTDDTLKALDEMTEAFRGYTKWSMLRTEHYRVLLQRAMIVMESLSVNEREDAEHHVVKTFNTLLLRLIKRLSEDTGASIEFMRVHRMSHKEIVFDFSASMNMNFGPPPPAPGVPPREPETGPFRVIVSPDETT